MTAKKASTPKSASKPARKTAARVEHGHGSNAKEKRINEFVEHYLANGCNARQAALAAGFSPKSADNAAYRLLKNAQVMHRIDERQQALASKFEINTESVLKNLAQTIYFDPRKLYNQDGSLKSIHELDEDTAMALAGFEAFEEFAGRGAERAVIGFTKKIKWLDKNAARDQANKILGHYKKDNEQPNAGLAAAIQEASSIASLRDKFNQVLSK